MLSKKTKYTIQVVVILAVFFFVLFNLVFKLIVDINSEAKMKKAQLLEKERIKSEFIAGIDEQYGKLLTSYNAEEYEKTIDIIKTFNKHGQSDYKDLPEIKKEIRLIFLRKKLESIPKIQLNDYVQLSEEIAIDVDESTEVFIRVPRYGQYFYVFDFPIILEGIALSIKGDFSDSITWNSNIDGELGKGKKLAVRLSYGEHQIIATGTNGITTGSMTTRIFVERDPDFLKYYFRE